MSMKVTLYRVTCMHDCFIELFFNTDKKQKVLGTFPLVHNASFSRVFNVLIELVTSFSVIHRVKTSHSRYRDK